MKALPLNPGSYSGTYKLVGEEVSLDFVNTVSWPDRENRYDWLEESGNLQKWAVAVKLIDNTIAKKINQQPPFNGRKEMAKVVAIREVLTAILKPLAFKKMPSPASLLQIETLADEIYKRRFIDQKTLKWKWKTPATLVDILAPVVANAIHVLTNVDHTRIKYCPTCDWLFFDHTRNRSRKWCDMEDCGSRDKALRYYHRKKK